MNLLCQFRLIRLNECGGSNYLILNQINYCAASNFYKIASFEASLIMWLDGEWKIIILDHGDGQLFFANLFVYQSAFYWCFDRWWSSVCLPHTWFECAYASPSYYCRGKHVGVCKKISWPFDFCRIFWLVPPQPFPWSLTHYMMVPHSHSTHSLQIILLLVVLQIKSSNLQIKFRFPL